MLRHSNPSALGDFYFVFENRVLSISIRGVISSTPRTGMAVATQRVRRGDLEDFAALPPIGTRSPGKSPPSAPLFDTTSARDAAMKDDYRQISRGALARTNELSERAILWGMIFTALVAIAVTIKGLVG